MLYNPSDNVVHKDAVFMRNIWHQQILKNLAKEIQFEISTNCTSTPDTRLQVFLAWARQQFEKLFPPPAQPSSASKSLAINVVPSVKKLKPHAPEDDISPSQVAAVTCSTPVSPAPHPVIKLSFQSKVTPLATPIPFKSAISSGVNKTHSPLPSKAAAPAVAVAAKEVSSAPAPKAFDISAVPGVKVSGPLLRSCSKAVSTIAGDADMVWFLSPGKMALSRACCCSFGLMQFCQWTTKRCSCTITPKL